jgi:hypothetical protein
MTALISQRSVDAYLSKLAAEQALEPKRRTRNRAISEGRKGGGVTQPASGECEIVPVGKYRGLPIETLLSDENYVEWLTTQPGIMAMLQSKHPAVFNIISIGTPATSDTPEHIN